MRLRRWAVKGYAANAPEGLFEVVSSHWTKRGAEAEANNLNLLTSTYPGYTLRFKAVKL